MHSLAWAVSKLACVFDTRWHWSFREYSQCWSISQCTDTRDHGMCLASRVNRCLMLWVFLLVTAVIFTTVWNYDACRVTCWPCQKQWTDLVEHRMCIMHRMLYIVQLFLHYMLVRFLSVLLLCWLLILDFKKPSVEIVKEFVVRPVRDRAHWQLVWTHYAVRTCNRWIFSLVRIC